MSEHVCRLCKRALVQRNDERPREFNLRRFCGQTCKEKLAYAVQREKRARERAIHMRTPPVMDFAPHEIVPRDGGYMTRIDRALPERSLMGCSAAWTAATGGEQ